MGYLTTVTLYNDGLGLLKKYPEEFCEKLYEASSIGKTTDIGLGGFANFATVQSSRHADDHTIYVHMGNCVVEVNEWSKEFEKLVSSNPEFARQLVNFLKTEVEILERFLKLKEKTSSSS